LPCEGSLGAHECVPDGKLRDCHSGPGSWAIPE
jgi:hypothetical protein